MEKINSATPDLVQSNIEAISELFPNVVTEAYDSDGQVMRSIDFDQLRQELSDHLVEGPKERFHLDWPGKRQAIFTANAPVAKTLRPLRDNSVDFDHTKNLFVEGENLDALKLLQESYLGKIKIIYIDPPYNTGNDFVYQDDFAESNNDFLLKSGQIDEDGFRFVTNPYASGRIHSVWLSNIYPRLKLARNLMTDDGVIFISIGKDEQANLRRICDEIFGEMNFVEVLVWNKRIPKNDEGIGSIHEYVLIYARDKSKLEPLTVAKEGIADVVEVVNRGKAKSAEKKAVEDELRVLYKKNAYDRGITLYNSLTNDYRLFGKVNMSWPNASTAGPRYDVIHPSTGRPVKVPDRGWRWKYETFLDASGFNPNLQEYSEVSELHDGSYLCGRIWFSKSDSQQPSSVIFLDDVERFLLRSVVSLKSDGGVEVENLFGGKSLFPYPKPTTLIKRLIQSHASSKDAIVLDFYGGSGTTAHAVYASNADDGGARRFILIQSDPPVDESSEIFRAGFKSISAFSQERIRRAASRLRDEIGLSNESSDLGFRVLRIDSPSQIEVLARPDEYSQVTISSLAVNLKEDRSPEDLLFQALIDFGLDLSLPVLSLEQCGFPVFDVDGGALIACFALEITNDLVRSLAGCNPLRVVFRDSSFASDAARINVEQIFSELSPETQVRVI